ncbi:DUF58 domain-containing protein [Candidatus Nanohalobium constans]|uniref:DUF58 domain-containing protein n=1 Tax=Candidatus Nanohalobium constans TaxID=2565781 RepID=A0A5Q0UEV9_9ARCH|nr:DUF58 domain-containing protein [Candidatus Nanohalobium constans]QGA80122.1 hypothetical protein LC1Nh_0218 [Candidatus Nanohalobium constans]
MTEMREEDFFETDDVVAEVDSEVKRVADTFRFALKYKEQFQASGIEFSDLRQYNTSDDASRIDWKNSAKSEDLFVKEYEEEKDMDVFIALDASNSMMFGTTDKMKSEYAAVVAAAIAYASTDAGIDVGFGLFGEDELYIAPGGGNAQYQRILHEVADFGNYGGDFNLEHALNSIIGQIKENTSVFIISDFIRPKGDWKSKMLVASKKFRHVMNVMVKDLRDYKLPDNGNMRFGDISTGEQLVVNTSKVKEEYNEEAQKREERIVNKVEGAGASIIKIDTRDQFSAKFAKYFDEAGEDW